MIDNMFVLMLLLLMINLILIFKSVPIFGIPIAIFTIFFSGMYFIFDVDIPANPVTSTFLIFIAVASIYMNFNFIRGKK
jgi:hypothetical protein